VKPARAIAGEVAIAWGVTMAVVAGLFVAAHRAAGMFAYPMDDTYIHMAVADTLVRSGTWGINPGEFASASSSPLWTLLLAAGFAVFGRAEWLPLALASVSALVLLVAAARLLVDLGVSRRGRVLALLVAVVATPLPILVGLGMEHVLHAALVLFVVRGVVRALEEHTLPPGLLVATALAPMVRYESLFVALAAALLLAQRRRWKAAGALLLAAAALPAAFGGWSMLQGAYPIPNSLLMKSGYGTGWRENLLANLSEGRALVGLVVAVAVGSWRQEAGHLRTAGWMFVVSAVVHFLISSTGSFFRYEAYLLVLGTIVLAASVRRSGRLTALATAVAAILLVLRTADAVRWFPGRCLYIADVKVRVARALAEVDPTSVVAAHDIGALAWETDNPVFDLAGLGSQDVTRLSVEHLFTGTSIANLAARHGATVAIAVTSWMANDRPPGWREEGRLIWGPDPTIRGAPISVYTLPGGDDPSTWVDYAVGEMQGAATFERSPE
jgi:hypothetical protein